MDYASCKVKIKRLFQGIKNTTLASPNSYIIHVTATRFVVCYTKRYPLSRLNYVFRSLSGGAGTPQFQNLSGAVRNATQAVNGRTSIALGELQTHKSTFIDYFIQCEQ